MRTIRWLSVLMLLAVPLTATAQSRNLIEVHGVVVDEETGEPLEGVTVYLPDGQIGTVTNEEGRYTLRGVPNANTAVLANRIGYIPEARALWVCTPIIHPHGTCTPTSARDQVVRFFMRPALEPRGR